MTRLPMYFASPRSLGSPTLRTLVAVLATALLLAAPTCRAELQDEIQVYDDDINKPGETGLELHFNTTPTGRRAPAYSGEVVSHHGTRLTAELSRGLTPTLEAGLYLPLVIDASGRTELAGAKVRLKWIPWQAPEAGGAFGGVNFELSRLRSRYSESRTTLEARFIGGWKGGDWLFAVNPALGFALSDVGVGQAPDLRVGAKLSRRLAEGISLGLEHYAGLGSLNRLAPGREQDHRLFVALDVDRGRVPFNIGIGRGLTSAADRWTVKAIFEIPL